MAVFLNRRDASRYRDLEAFLPGLDLFLKLKKMTEVNINKKSIIHLSLHTLVLCSRKNIIKNT